MRMGRWKKKRVKVEGGREEGSTAGVEKVEQGAQQGAEVMAAYDFLVPAGLLH